MSEPFPFEDCWLPYNIRYDKARLVVDWCNLAEHSLEEPFFDLTIHRLLKQNPNASSTTSIEALAEFNSKKTLLTPSGFIFHLSRCGSTLIGRMLASVEEFTVFSEPAILETILRAKYQPSGVSNEQKQWLLKNVIQALVCHKAHRENSFIKFSARAILDYKLITQAFPSVPCIFVYREPVEVLVSLSRNQTDSLPPGLDKAGLLNESPERIRMMRPVEFWALVVASQCAAALEMCGNLQPFLVNYNQLPEAVWTNIAEFFGTSLSLEDIKKMREVSKQNSKEPQRRFLDDTANKRNAATEETHTVAERFARTHYNRLESIRLKAESG